MQFQLDVESKVGENKDPDNILVSFLIHLVCLSFDKTRDSLNDDNKFPQWKKLLLLR